MGDGDNDVLALEKATYRKVMQNLWWAMGYNIVAFHMLQEFCFHLESSLTLRLGLS
ncbi:hypothetical protein [Brevibacillus laterosporus]|uniref:hypothetical protein n=1 Tax=Brevibacillus laterosporus TaxID=1465 RepID=UPI003D1C1035